MKIEKQLSLYCYINIIIIFDYLIFSQRELFNNLGKVFYIESIWSVFKTSEYKIEPSFKLKYERTASKAVLMLLITVFYVIIVFEHFLKGFTEFIFIISLFLAT